MPAQIPSEEEVLSYFDKLSNWGRWGEDDQHGTLNLLSKEKTLRAASLIQEGTTVSCSRTVTWTPEADHMATPLHFMLESGEGWASGDKVTNRPSQAATDFFGMAFPRLSHHAYGQPRPLLLAGQDVQRASAAPRIHWAWRNSRVD